MRGTTVAIIHGAAELVARDQAALRRAASCRGERASPWDEFDGFQLVGKRRQSLPLLVDGTRTEIVLSWPDGRLNVTAGETTSRPGDPSEPGALAIVGSPDGVYVLKGGRQTFVQMFDPFDVDPDHLEGGDTITAPMHGKLVAVFVAPGDTVEKGQRLAIVEAMKMEHVLLAPRTGEVADVLAEPGAQLAQGATILTLSEAVPAA